jgi:hypothetical protein
LYGGLYRTRVDGVVMSDYEKVKELLTMLGIGFEEFENSNCKYLSIDEDCKNVKAYEGHTFDFNFDFNDEFVSVEMYK